jgi:cyclophilin family peptidyl-prolyl cis-trans isomerase
MSDQRPSGARSMRPPEPSNRRSPWPWIIGAAASVAVIAIVIALLLRAGDDGDEPTEVVNGAGAIGDEPCPPQRGAEERTTEFDSGPQGCIDPTRSYRAVVSTTRGELAIDLDAAAAPMAVNNFVFLSRHRYYDGVAFHRIIPDFVVQGGDATGVPPGTGGPGYTFADELPEGGPPFYEIGSVAMANAGPDTNGSQFFIVTGEQGAQLPPNYSRFGQVVEGLDVVDQIEATGSPDGQPTEETTIESVVIEER